MKLLLLVSFLITKLHGVVDTTTFQPTTECTGLPQCVVNIEYDGGESITITAPASKYSEIPNMLILSKDPTNTDFITVADQQSTVATDQEILELTGTV